MARYDRDYGQDFNQRYRDTGPRGGMRSDAWRGTDWAEMPGDDGYFGNRFPDRNTGSFNRGVGYGGYGYDTPGYEGFAPNRNAGYGARPGPAVGGGYGGETMEWTDYGPRGASRGYSRRERGFNDGWRTERDWSTGSGSGRMLRASDLMTENPEAVTGETPISEVATKMRELDVGIIPVVDKGDKRRLRGVVTDRDIAIRAVAEGKASDTPVSECMTDRVRSVNKNDSIHDVMRVMKDEQVRRVTVTDREGRLVGIIAQADLAVDFAGDNRSREIEVGDMLERVSSPARPERFGADGGGRWRGDMAD